MVEQKRDLDAVFLREVVSKPTDDAALLIYADWLMDQSDIASQSRGEYLRMIWLTERTRDRREHRDLKWRTQELWWTHVETWLGSLYDVVDHFIYERGRFCLEISQELFCRCHPAELYAEPAWDWVTDIVVRRGNLELLLHLGQAIPPPLLASVDIGRHSLDEGELDYLLSRGFWAGVPELQLHHNYIDDAALAALAYWRGLDGVEKLDITGGRFGSEGLLALCSSPYVKALEQLTLSRLHLSQDLWNRLQQRFHNRLRWT